MSIPDSGSAPLLRVEHLVRDYTLPRTRLFGPARHIRVLHGVTLALDRGGSLGIVGESGSGKSTLARSVLGLEQPQSGSVRLLGQNLFAVDRTTLRGLRRHIQAVFQDPYGSLDPRQRVGRIIAEPIAALERTATRSERAARVTEALEAVGLSAAAAGRYPHEFSGGQRQRIAIARALVTRPALVVADEPVSALDVSIQAQVLNLMMDLRARFGLAWLFISHDLGVVRWITERVAVLYLGRIVEEGPTVSVFDTPRHPYTQALVDAVPRPGIPGKRRAPDPAGPPPVAGCPYAPRCPLVQDRCRTELPLLRSDAGRSVACHFA